MGSGQSHSAQFEYVGNGGSAAQQFKPGFEPKYAEIRSLEGCVKMAFEKEELPWKSDAAGAVSQLAAADLSIVEDFGVQVDGSDDALNKAATDYILMVWA